MFAPANLVHHQEFYEFSQEFDLAAKPQYFMQPAYSAPGAGPSAVTAKNIGGAFIAIGTTLVSAAVIYDSKAGKEAKFVSKRRSAFHCPSC